MHCQNVLRLQFGENNRIILYIMEDLQTLAQEVGQRNTLSVYNEALKWSPICTTDKWLKTAFLDYPRI
jgi:hypothetical protein